MRRLRILREAAGISGFELARVSRVNPSDVSAIELGRRTPPVGSVMLERLASALDFAGDPAALLEEVDSGQAAC